MDSCCNQCCLALASPPLKQNTKLFMGSDAFTPTIVVEGDPTKKILEARVEP